MDRRRVFEGRRTLIGLLMVSIYGLACRNALCAVESDSLSIGALKHLSIEELMNLDVTSVSKQPEPYGRAPAAIQVITQNEIRRAGASSTISFMAPRRTPSGSRSYSCNLKVM